MFNEYAHACLYDHEVEVTFIMNEKYIKKILKITSFNWSCFEFAAVIGLEHKIIKKGYIEQPIDGVCFIALLIKTLFITSKYKVKHQSQYIQ